MTEKNKVNSSEELTAEEMTEGLVDDVETDREEVNEEQVEDSISEASDDEEKPDLEDDKKRSKIFGKKKDKKDKKDEKIAELTDMIQRHRAEFDNYRKRTSQEKAGMYVVGAKEIVEKMLPVVDSFERGLAAVPAGEEESPFVAGMNMIYKQLMTALEEVGVTPIAAVGEEFNPDLHNAVMHIESDEVGDNIVVEELQKGYRYKDFVVRHSMVKVAN